MYFAQKLRELSGYNDEAASSSWTGGYGNPWQIIYLFDGDPETKVVCEGFSKGFQYLCDYYTELFRFKDEETYSYIVTGTMSGGGHMWNMVHYNGENYMVDITNCSSLGTYNYLFLAGYSSGAYDTGYELRRGTQSFTYKYDDNTKAYYPADYLTLSKQR